MPELLLPDLVPVDPTRWFAPEALRPARATPAQLSGILQPAFARALREVLLRAPYRRHHHAAYPIDVAPLSALPAGPLQDFVDWLHDDDAARTHAALAGARGPLRCRQVQIARIEPGQRFPLHEDTDEDGVAAVYYLGERVAGGALVFEDGPRLAPAFNSLALFRPRGARHAVEPVTRGRRLSITAFFLR